MSVYRKLALLAGAGPVCSECVYVHPGTSPGRPDLWQCRAEKQVSRNGWSRHIDGKGSEPLYDYGWCRHRNNDGQCKDYKSQAGVS